MSLAFFTFAIPGGVEAAPHPISLKPGQNTTLLRAGVVTGGVAGDELSLLTVESKSKSEGESFSIHWGDREGRPWTGRAGWYHIALDRGGRRVVVDLGKVARTAIEPKDLHGLLASSKLIASSDMTMDPQDGSTNLTLNFRVPIQLRVMGEKASRGPLSLEFAALEPLPSTSRGSGEK